MQDGQMRRAKLILPGNYPVSHPRLLRLSTSAFTYVPLPLTNLVASVGILADTLAAHVVEVKLKISVGGRRIVQLQKHSKCSCLHKDTDCFFPKTSITVFSAYG